MVNDITPNDMIMREAVLGDHDEILNITKDENLYDGRDYLPYNLQDWLKDGIEQNSNRRNLVFLLKGGSQIVGFRSIYLQNGGTVVFFCARRIHKDMRGKGFGKRICELTVEYLNSNFPLATQSILSIGNSNISDKDFDSKPGKRLSEKTSKTYQLKVNDRILDKLAANVSTSLKNLENTTTENRFKFIAKDEYNQVLGNKQFVSAALENDMIVLNWVPVLIKAEENFDFAAKNSQYVLVEGSVQNPIALSIFTCSEDWVRVVLDYYTITKKLGTSRSTVVEHLTKHLIHCKEINNKMKKEEKRDTDKENEEEGGKMNIEIFQQHKEDFKETEDDLQKAGVDYKHIFCGKMKRDATLYAFLLKELA